MSKVEKEYWNDYWNDGRGIALRNEHEAVGRTQFGRPVSQGQWQCQVEHIRGLIGIDHTKSKRLLDVCCGNGLLSRELLNDFSEIHALDFSKPLLDNFVTKSSNIVKIHANLLDFKPISDSYGAIIFHFAIQHFTWTQSVSIIEKLYFSLKPNGRMLIGDIPDLDRMWKFYSTSEYRNFYFSMCAEGKEHVGTWFKRDFFLALGDYLGARTIVVTQPDVLINSTYRFDIIYEKK